MKKQSGFTLIELLVVVAIIGILASLILPAINRAILSAHRAEIKATISVVEQAMSMYHADLNVYPPDKQSSAPTAPGNADQCTPDNRAAAQGNTNGFDTQESAYSDEHFMRYLDGDTSNDPATGGFDEVSARPLDTYLDINEDNLEDNDDGMPVLVTRFNLDISDPETSSTIKYNEFDSERRTAKKDKKDDDPEIAVVRFDSFQLFCEAENIDETDGSVDRSRFLTNFRDN